MSILFSQLFSKNNEIRPQEVIFTEVLASIALVPKRLYFYGKMPKKRLKTLAIVGTRKPTKYGEKVAYELAFAAAKRGAVVVSGLAFGIDSIAHRAALDAGGLTVAVLGTPIDYIYPKAHIGLAADIVEHGGVVMSELPRGADFHPKSCFLKRNRIIAGLADVVVIPEAAERSGSLNTATHALEQGKEVLAVPGDISRPMSRGCNQLIRQGAMPYLGVDDVMSLLFPASPQRCRPEQVVGDSLLETGVLRLLAAGVVDGEAMIEPLKVSVAELNQTLTLLEIKGRVRALGANLWSFVK